MNPFYFLITFVLVNVSAENDETWYKVEVSLANEAIELAYNKNDLVVGGKSGLNGLEHVIENLVNNTSSFEFEDYECFAKINFMIAVPEKLDIIINIPVLEFEDFDPMTRGNLLQNQMRYEIIKALDIAVPDTEDVQDFEALNLTTLAEDRRRLVKLALKNIFRRVYGTTYNQFIMQLELRDTLNLQGLNLTTLAEERRVTGTSLENIIRRRVIGTNIPQVVEDQKERRVTGTSLENIILQREFGTNIPQVVEDQSGCQDVSFLRLCRLIGLYMSTQFPESYIKKLWIDPNCCTCTLDDGITQKIYQKLNGVLWLISPTT